MTRRYAPGSYLWPPMSAKARSPGRPFFRPVGVAKENDTFHCRNSDRRNVAAWTHGWEMARDVWFLDQPLQWSQCFTRSDILLRDPLQTAARHTLPLLPVPVMWKRMWNLEWEWGGDLMWGAKCIFSVDTEDSMYTSHWNSNRPSLHQRSGKHRCSPRAIRECCSHPCPGFWCG